MWVQSLALLSRLRIWHCRDLWCRPAAVAPIRPLAWEPPFAAGTALGKKKKKDKLLDVYNSQQVVSTVQK